MSREPLIRSVADTALWMAALRAQETARSDALFQDPFAEGLAGERGRRMRRKVPGSALVGWGLVIRTSAIDRLIDGAVRAGVDAVVNLGAGMDTRPYRMNLPRDLAWLEVDLPAIIQLKNAVLDPTAAVCQLERSSLDILDVASRQILLREHAAQYRRVLVIAEGLIPYLANADVQRLADDLAALPTVGGWILDFDNAGPRREPRAWSRCFRDAPFRFVVNDWFDFFSRSKWRTRHVITSGEEAERCGRQFPYTFPLGWLMHLLPASIQQKILSTTGAVLLEKS